MVILKENVEIWYISVDTQSHCCLGLLHVLLQKYIIVAFKINTHFDCYRPKRSCEGYIFTGVCLLPGGGGYLLPGESAPGVGGWGNLVSAPRGYLLLEGVSALGGGASSWGGVCSGGVCSWGVGIPACTEADTPPPRRDGYKTIEFLLIEFRRF